MNRLGIFFLSFLLPLSLQAKTEKVFRITPPSKEEMALKCQEAEIEVPSILGDSVTKENGVICFNKLMTRMTSKPCQEVCEIDQLARKVKSPIEYKGVGTPGALLCEKLGGQSQVVFLVANGEKTKIDRCLLKKDFVSLGFLFERWARKQKN